MSSIIICITGFLVFYIVAGKHNDLTGDTANRDETLAENVLIRNKRQVPIQYRHQRFCDGSLARLSCPLHQVIVMKQGWYGGLSCAHPGQYFYVATATCGESVREKLSDLCAFENTCSFMVSQAVIGGGLTGCSEDHDRDIFVQYDCGDVVIAPAGPKGERGLPGPKGERGAAVPTK
ncbi:Hypothetical predicted protein [Mytilus galloprovincialis]|uniref:SUEL-type lectin domain-containing protein n=2 Tax=Mytilus galloprovincialis TaxID=29158 RepID=A0A8B6D1L6_MYTGA|nr:Hypothetical predicted protein [Mytilus galloprovincialis]